MYTRLLTSPDIYAIEDRLLMGLDIAKVVYTVTVDTAALSGQGIIIN